MDEHETHEQRIRRFQHAVQTGIALEMKLEPDGAATSPKHMRVGVDSSLVFGSALAGLLIKKGLITEDEYAEACANAMEREALQAEIRLRQRFNNPNIRLV